MRPVDWVVLAGTLLGIISYGLYRARGSTTTRSYLLAGKTMPWYAMGLSIMATQASAITFISTTGQAYVDGMRFVQFYFGLPIAMVLICATAVPIFHRANVYTAYEYLERRFDAKTRALVSILFLIQRGLGVGVALSAPAVVLTVLLGWPYQATTILVGGAVIVYTVTGGIKAVTWTDVQQMMIIFLGLFVALFTALSLLPAGVGFFDAVRLAGVAGRLNAVDTHFDWNNRYTLWSGLIGGSFLALSYFGCDQSQVQRYLTGRSIAQSRLGLLFNAMAKVPMQFLILFIGTMVFVFFLFEKPPVLFQPVELARIQSEPGFSQVQSRYDRAFERRREAARVLAEAKNDTAQSRREFRYAEQEVEAARKQAAALVERANGKPGFNDTNYVFLTFVTRYMPAGVLGLVMAAILAAAMSSSSGEINSLATVTVIDIYRRNIRQEAPDRHYLWASRVATALWGCFAIGFAQYVRNLGALIEAVNMVGSLFYGGMLGVFTLAFFFPRVRGTAAFCGVLAGEAAILAAARFTEISFLWYNVVGCLVVILAALLLNPSWPAKPRLAPAPPTE